MNSDDRLLDLKAGGAFLAWNVRDFPVTCLVMLAQALCYATLRLCQAGQLPLDFQLWFFEVYDNRLLSTAAIAEGRYYTLVTSLLFIADWVEVLSEWVGLWFILSYIERAFRWYTALLVLLLPCIACNVTFLLFAGWTDIDTARGLTGIRAAMMDWCRPERTINNMPWRLAPLWWGIAAFALVRLRTVRVIGGRVPMWLFVFGMIALEFTIVRWTHGQYYARDTLAASAAAGFLISFFTDRPSRSLRFRRPSVQERSERDQPAESRNGE